MMDVTPDGARYLAMGQGRRVPLPFHLRWLPSWLCRGVEWRWRALHVVSLVGLVVLFGVYLGQRGLTGWQIAAGVALAALLPGVGRFHRVFPVLVDCPGQMLALAAVVVFDAGWWPAAVLLVLAAGATKESAPVHAAVWAWHPVLLVGLVAPLLRLLVKAGPELDGAGIRMAATGRLAWHTGGLWFVWQVMLAPWGPVLAALYAPSWQVAAAVVAGYGQFLVLNVTGLPVWNGHEEAARLYMWSFPVLVAAAVVVVPVPWLAVVVAAAAFNPWGQVLPGLRPAAAATPVHAEVAAPVTVAAPVARGKVALGYSHAGQLEAEFAESMAFAREYDATLPEPIFDPRPAIVAGGPRLHVMRDLMVRTFLTETDAEWLCSLDVDHRWEPDAIHRLLASADPVARPIVGGLCFGTGRSGGRLFPTIFTTDPATGERGPLFDYPRDALVECASTGFAFLLVHRSVFERMDAAFNPDGTDLQPWFPDGQVGDDMVECDLAFCMRARAIGIPVHVNTSVEAPHKKPIFLDQEFYDLVRALQEAT